MLFISTPWEHIEEKLENGYSKKQKQKQWFCRKILLKVQDDKK